MELSRHAFTAMGCPCEVRLFCDDTKLAEEAAARCVAEARRFEAKYSRYLPGSITTQINSSAGRSPVTIDPETASILDYSGVCFEQSHGLFDITSGVLRTIWHPTMQTLPTNEALDQCLSLVGWNKIQRSADSIFLPSAGMEVDFGGVVKEYAADALAEIAKSLGIRSGLINLGGDIRIIGPQPCGSAWSIGITHPTEKDSAFAVIEVEEGAITTSGSYERYFEIGENKYSHLINPITGWPVSGLLSVSIFAPLAIVAGSIASIALLNTKEAGLEFLNECHLPYLAIDQNMDSYGNLAK